MLGWAVSSGRFRFFGLLSARAIAGCRHTTVPMEEEAYRSGMGMGFLPHEPSE